MDSQPNFYQVKAQTKSNLLGALKSGDSFIDMAANY